MLELGVDGIKVFIAKVSCRSFSSLLHYLSWYIKSALNCPQSSFTARESGAYLKGPIRTRRYIAAQGTDDA